MRKLLRWNPGGARPLLWLVFAPAFALAFMLGAVAEARAVERYQGHIEFGARPGSDRLLGEGELFIPVWQNERSLAFFNVIGRLDDEDSREGNWGLGFRRIVADEVIVGGYGFFDLRRTPNGNAFRQGTIGFDLLTRTLDLRLNVYLPEATQREVDGTASANVFAAGTGFRITSQAETRERALPGVDFEIGSRVPLLPTDTRVYLAGFHFDADGYEHMTGVRGRIETRLLDLPFLGYGSELVVGFEGQWDTVRHADVRGLTRIRIPFGRLRGPKTPPPSQELSRLERRMTTRVVRDVDVVAGLREAPVVEEAARISLGGKLFAGFDGTLVAGDPLTADVAAAGAGALLLVDGSAGTLTTASRIDLQPGQTLVGGGSVLSIVGAASGRTFSVFAPGSRPTILGTAGNREIFRTADGTRLEGLDLRGGRDGIDVRASDGVTLRDLTVAGTGRRGAIVRTNSSNVLFQDVRFSNTGNEGLRVVSSTGVTLDGVSISGAGGSAGLRIQNATNLAIRNLAIENTNQRGLWVRNATNVSLLGASVRNTNNEGVRLQGSNGVTLDGLTVFGAGGAAGLRIHATDAVVFRNGSITGSTNRGIRFSGTSNGISGSGNTVTGNGSQDCFNGGTVNASTLTINGGTPCP